MKNYLLHSFNALWSIAKRFIVLLVSVGMLLSLSQPAALAAHSANPEMQLESSQMEVIPDELDSPAKEERREWQSEASSIREEEKNIPSTLSEKLNLDELAKGFDPEREAEKRSVPTP